MCLHLLLACVLKLFVTSCYLTQTYVVVNYVSHLLLACVLKLFCYILLFDTNLCCCQLCVSWNCVSKLFVSIHYSLQTYFVISYVFIIVYPCVEAFCYILLFNFFFFSHFMVVASIISFVKKKFNAWKYFINYWQTSINKKLNVTLITFLFYPFIVCVASLFVCLFVCQFIMDETHITNVVVMSYIASSWNSFKTWPFHAYVFKIQTWFTKKSWLCVGCYKSSSILHNKCFKLLFIWLNTLGETQIYYLIFKICLHKNTTMNIRFKIQLRWPWKRLCLVLANHSIAIIIAKQKHKVLRTQFMWGSRWYAQMYISLCKVWTFLIFVLNLFTLGRKIQHISFSFFLLILENSQFSNFDVFLKKF
jgi:hypothetical protein